VNRTALALMSACVAALGLAGCGGLTSKRSDQSSAPSQALPRAERSNWIGLEIASIKLAAD
jgi:hypothetical protein